MNTATPTIDQRWPIERIQHWYQQQSWLCGFNFLPSSAVNFVDMWDATRFDALTIQRELQWASQIGFNTLRTNLPFYVWLDNPTGFKQRIGQFLEQADRVGIKSVFCLFDDCGFSGQVTTTGEQSSPIAGVHNSRAVASPGRETVMNKAGWHALKAYTEDILSHYRDDPRVLYWDLYNEPANIMVFNQDGQHEITKAYEAFALELLALVFRWSREINPSQPLSVSAWHVPFPWKRDERAYFQHPVDHCALGLSDLISFHAYLPLEKMQQCLAVLKDYERPILCTEWMARSVDSRIDTLLPWFKQNNIGCWQWGLVNGKTQTHIPWPAIIDLLPEYDEKQSEWFHDLLYQDGKPYATHEVALIRELTGRNC